MRNIENNYDYQRDYQYSKILLFVLMLLFGGNLFLEFFYVKDFSFKELIFSLVFFGIFFKFYYKALSELLYTFWGLSLFLFPYLLYSFVYSLSYGEYTMGGDFYLLMIVLHVLMLYLMSSPVYYPRVPWWEYDFRYRVDLKINVYLEDQKFDGRLTDLRRSAGCIVMFKEMKLGSEVTIDPKIEETDFTLKCVLTSLSEQIPGRGFSYGVKFIFKDSEAKANFSSFMELWNKRNKVKIQEKFKTS
jgi:hypothetical protein